jgi:hypothetical protein
MKTKKILAISVLALGLMLSEAEVTKAIPMGTAFTYQGRLMDANSAADGLYDFQFRIYNDPCTGTQQASPIDINDLDVMDGYFTVELDFGSDVFDGDARWLEIAVMPGDSMGRMTTLSPRQEITPAPYALYAASTGGDGDWAVDGDDMYAIPSGYVGIGTVPTSAAKLEVINSSGTGVRGEVTGASGSGISGIASNTGNYITYGGYFLSKGGNGSGVKAGATGDSGKGVYAVATNPNDVTNYGGYFYSSGGSGRGVYGEAARSGRYTNYGGYFLAKGDTGRGVYGEATGDEGCGVYGVASESITYNNYGGYFTAAGASGRGVYGYASASAGTNYGVYGKTDSNDGYAGFFKGGRSYFEGKVVIGSMGLSSYKLYVHGDAFKTQGGTTWATLSDVRLKDIHGAYEYGLSQICKLNPVRFKYKDNNQLGLECGKELVGLVAQEVQEVVPEAVAEADNGYLSLNADAIIWSMVNAIKELKAENQALKTQLEVQTQSLKQRLEALESSIQQQRLVVAR